MGLRRKSKLFGKKKKRAPGGLLSKAIEYSEPLEAEITLEEKGSREIYGETEESEAEGESGRGLLEKASALAGAKLEVEPQGLLKKASSIAVGLAEEKGEEILEERVEIPGEGAPEEEPKGGLLARAALVYEELQEEAAREEQPEVKPVIQPQRVEAVSEVVGEEEVLESRLKQEATLREKLLEEIQFTEGVLEAVAEPVVGEAMPSREAVEVKKQAFAAEAGPGALESELEEAIEPELEEMEGLVEKPEPEGERVEPTEKPVKFIVERMQEYIKTKSSIEILRLLNEIIRDEGYTAFFTQVTETFIRQGRGKAVIIYLASNGKFVADYYLPETSDLKKICNKSIRQNSKLIEIILSKKEPVRSESIKDEALIKETALFQNLEPWMVVPLATGSDLSGFALIGNQPKRPKLDMPGLLLFSNFCTGYIARYISEKSYARQIGKIEKERETQKDLLNLYILPDTALESLNDAVESMYHSLNVESAALVTGWGEKGKLTVVHSVGIPKKLLNKYTIQKNDKEIRRIIEGRKPGVPKEAKKRIAKWAGEKDDQFKTYITVPILFKDELLGIINIHRMKGAGLKPSATVREKIAHGARSVIPYFLEWKISHSDPFSVLESVVNEEITSAHKCRQPLHFILFTLGKRKESSEAIKLEKYTDLALKVYNIIEKTIGDNGVVKRVDLTRSLLILRNMEDVEADEFIKVIKKDFMQRLIRGKLGEALTLVSHITRVPQDQKDTQEILRWVYGVT